MKNQRVAITIIVLCSIFFMLLGSQLANAEGGKIVFNKLIDGKWQIVVTDENGQNMCVLSKNNKKNDYEPSWSFDGKYIAFISDRDGTDPNEILNLYIMDADGSNQRLLTKKNKDVKEHYPSFSPDGKKIVFTRTVFLDQPQANQNQFDSKLYTIDINGMNEKYLTDGSYAKWTPNGMKMLFLPYENGCVQCIVTIMDINKNQVRIRKGCDPSWSLDGKYVAFTYYDGVGWEIYKMDSDGNNVVCLTNGGASWLPACPSWSPDGKHIVFFDMVSNVAGGLAYKLYKINADGGTPVLISEDGCMFPSWSDPAYASFAVEPSDKSTTTWGEIKVYK